MDDSITCGGEHAIGHGQVLGGSQITQRRAGFRHDGIIRGLNKAVGDAHVTAAAPLAAVNACSERDAKFDERPCLASNLTGPAGGLVWNRF